jgi:hypothetical protein
MTSCTYSSRGSVPLSWWPRLYDIMYTAIGARSCPLGDPAYMTSCTYSYRGLVPPSWWPCLYDIMYLLLQGLGPALLVALLVWHHVLTAPGARSRSLSGPACMTSCTYSSSLRLTQCHIPMTVNLSLKCVQPLRRIPALLQLNHSQIDNILLKIPQCIIMTQNEVLLFNKSS